MDTSKNRNLLSKLEKRTLMTLMEQIYTDRFICEHLVLFLCHPCLRQAGVFQFFAFSALNLFFKFLEAPAYNP